MLRHATILSLAVLAASAAAQADVGTGASAPLRSGDAGKHLAVRVGQPVQFALPASLGNGYVWQVRSNPAFVVTAPARIARDPDNGQRDAALITGRFLRPGPMTLDIANVPMGGGGGNASSVLRYHFTVAQVR